MIQTRRSLRKDTVTGPKEASEKWTIQLLIADDGNRSVIRSMLWETYEVVTGSTIRDADLYLVDDRLLGSFSDGLQDAIDGDSGFRPLVVIRGQPTKPIPAISSADDEEGLTIDEYVDAPIDRQLLRQRVHSLLVRRHQSQQLIGQMTVLANRERALRQFELALEDTGSAVAITDCEGRIEFVNPAFEVITGVTEAAAIGGSLGQLESGESIDVFSETFWNTLQETKSWDGEVTAERSTGHQYVIEATVSAITTEDGGIEGFVAVMHDITDRIEREQALERNEQELELLRQVLTRHLRHNLRNDLNIILGYGELIEDRATGETHHDVRRIVETTNNLLKTSDAARLYSTLFERGSELSMFDLGDVVEEQTAEIQSKYPDVSIAVDIPAESSVLARFGVSEAIAELLENAVIHNDSDTPSLRISARESDGICLTIEDNGPGIPPHELSTLEQGIETPLNHSSGIGLWLSKWVVEGFGGELTFDASETGTTATMYFPPPGTVETSDLSLGIKSHKRRLQTIIRRVTDTIVEVSPSWKISFLDRKVEGVLDLDGPNLLGANFWDVFADLKTPSFEDSCSSVMESRTSTQTTIYSPRMDCWLEFYIYPNFDGGISLYVRDVTDQKEREQTLEETQHRLELALDAANAGVWDRNLDTDTVRWDEQTEALLGLDPGDFSGTYEGFLEYVHPADVADLESVIDAAIDEARGYEHEFRFIAENGDEIWILTRAEPLLDETGTPTRYVGVDIDISERKKQDAQLVSEHARFRSVFRDAFDAMVIANDAGEYIAANQRAAEVFGLSRDELIGRKIVDFAPEEYDVAAEWEAFHNSGWDFGEFPLVRPDGTERTVEFAASANIVPGEHLSVMRDITDRLARERELTERLKELSALKNATVLLDSSDEPLDSLLSNFIEALPDSFQYPDQTGASIRVDAVEISTPNFTPGENMLSASVDTNSGTNITLEVVASEDWTNGNSAAFLVEEQELIDTLVRLVKGLVERRADEIDRLSADGKQSTDGRS